MAAHRYPLLRLGWHGGKDRFSPVAHTQWLADHIPNAITEFPPDRAHFGALEIVPNVLSWLSGQASNVERPGRLILGRSTGTPTGG